MRGWGRVSTYLVSFIALFSSRCFIAILSLFIAFIYQNKFFFMLFKLRLKKHQENTGILLEKKLFIIEQL